MPVSQAYEERNRLRQAYERRAAQPAPQYPPGSVGRQWRSVAAERSIDRLVGIWEAEGAAEGRAAQPAPQYPPGSIGHQWRYVDAERELATLYRALGMEYCL